MMTDNDIIKALECCADTENKNCKARKCPMVKECMKDIDCLQKYALDFIKRQKAEIDELKSDLRLKTNDYNYLKEECEKIQKVSSDRKDRLINTVVNLKNAKSEAYKEFAEKINEVVLRYAHLHTYADQARVDEIETSNGKKIEMQSVWDVFTLNTYQMAEYEEMNRLQQNIETVAKERLLTELEKDFRLLVKERVGE